MPPFLLSILGVLVVRERSRTVGRCYKGRRNQLFLFWGVCGTAEVSTWTKVARWCGRSPWTWGACGRHAGGPGLKAAFLAGLVFSSLKAAAPSVFQERG